MHNSTGNEYQNPARTPPQPAYGQPAAGIPVGSGGRYYGGLNNPHHAPMNQTQPISRSRWSTGLCDCCEDVPNCCITCWCPCITFGQIAGIVDKGAISCFTSGALYALICFVTGCPCLYSCFYRSKMRQQYMLHESPCGDCMVHWCCEMCSLSQEYRELKKRGFDMSIGWKGNVEQQNRGVAMAPVVQGGMIR